MRRFVVALVLSSAFTASASAQESSLGADLLRDVGEVQQKIVGLAKAIPADKYSWRPAAGVRSIGEVIMHVASDNYFIPGAAGTPIPAATGISPDKYESVVAYEKRQVSATEAVKELEDSFSFLTTAMKAVSADAMAKKGKVFGMEMTGQQLWIMTTTHLHEHLGQMIAYARSVGVTPPWSK